MDLISTIKALKHQEGSINSDDWNEAVDKVLALPEIQALSAITKESLERIVKTHQYAEKVKREGYNVSKCKT